MGRNKPFFNTLEAGTNTGGKVVLGNDLHSNPRFVSFGQVSSFLSSHCCTWKTGDHADFTGLLPGLTDREYSAMSSRL